MFDGVPESRRLEKTLAPVKMLLSAKSVEDANDHVEVEKL